MGMSGARQSKGILPLPVGAPEEALDALGDLEKWSELSRGRTFQTSGWDV
jgi:hypothetical protein